MNRDAVLSEMERIKAESRFLRGTLHIGLEDETTGGIAEHDTKLIKFHGIYQQDDRDVRMERRRARLEPLYSFMLRVRIPGGVLSPAQWLTLDAMARERANGTLRLTTRQAVQLHGIHKENLRPLVRALEAAGLDSVAACGDVNRNVMASPNASLSEVHAAARRWAARLSERLLPQSDAYRDVWLDRRDRPAHETEPLYGPQYLPRKFKTVVVVPPVNDVDVFAHDLGFIAIEENGRLAGFNLTVGGGLGMSHDEPDTFPRLADVLGFLPAPAALDAAEAVVSIQRDFGNRDRRSRARLKYTIEEHGLDWFRSELEWRMRRTLAPARPYRFTETGDRYGWRQDPGGRWHLTLFVENGRLRRDALDGLAGIAADGLAARFILTPNQNLILAGVEQEARAEIEKRLEARGLDEHRRVTPLRRLAMACVAMPTCPLAMAEAERYLPVLLDRVEALLEKHGLGESEIVLRMTGCPNGCARPYLAEIGLIGKGPGRYNLHLGAASDGTRLNRLYLEAADEDQILESLDTLLGRYARERQRDERFGDFVIRQGIVAPVTHGSETRERQGHDRRTGT